MMKIQKQIDVRLLRKGAVNSLRVVQYDTGIQLVFNILDFVLPDGTTATLYVRKKSGKFVYQETGITVAENKVTVDLENQALTEHGETFYQLRFLNGSDVITTFSSSMFVEPSLADADAEESKTVVAAFEAKTAEQIAAIEAATDGFTALAKSAIEAKGSEVLASIPQEYTQTVKDVAYLQDNAANAIKGNLSGPVVVADDVSPVEHNPAVKVLSKNLIEFPYSDTTKVSNGITFTDNGDGSITANGTATGNAVFYFINHGNNYYVNGEVCISGCPAGGSFVGTGYSLRLNKYVDGSEVSGIVDIGAGKSGLFDNLQVRLYFVVLAGTTVENLTVRPMMEYGNTPSTYTPYIDPSTVTVKRCGKNLIPYPYMNGSKENQGVEFTVFDGGVISMKGTSADYAVFYVDNEGIELENGVTYDIVQPITKKAGLVLNYTDENGKSAWISSSIAWKNGYTYKGLYIQIDPDVTIDENFVPIVKRTSEPLDSYTPAADGTVSGIISLSPNMTILTDTEGVIVECEYTRDTKKYVDSAMRPTDEQVQDAVDAYLTENDQIGAVTQEDLNVFKKQVITDVIAALPVYNGEVV